MSIHRPVAARNKCVQFTTHLYDFISYTTSCTYTFIDFFLKYLSKRKSYIALLRLIFSFEQSIAVLSHLTSCSCRGAECLNVKSMCKIATLLYLRTSHSESLFEYGLIFQAKYYAVFRVRSPVSMRFGHVKPLSTPIGMFRCIVQITDHNHVMSRVSFCQTLCKF